MIRPKVSILIPVHNGEAYVGKAIRSVLAQDFQEFEVVVLDDGSTDGGARVARTFGDSRVRVYRRDEHEGIAATRNHLLIAAQGDLIAWLDCDDVIFPERIIRQAAYLQRHREIAAICSGWLEIDANGQTLGRRALPRDHATINRDLLQGKTVPSSCVMVRRQAIDAVGGLNPELKFGCEHELLLRIAEKARLGGLPEPLVKVRVHARSVSYTHRRPYRTGIEDAGRRAVLRRYKKELLVQVDATQTAETLVAGAMDAASPTQVVVTGSGEVRHQIDVNGAALPSELALEASPAGPEDRQVSLFPATAGEVVAADAVPAAGSDALDAVRVEAVPTELVTTQPGSAEQQLPTAAATDDATVEQNLTAPEAQPAEAGTHASTGGESRAGESAEALAPGDLDSAVAEPVTPTDEAAVVLAERPEPIPQVAVILQATGIRALEAIRSVLDQDLDDLVLAVVATESIEGLERGLEILGDPRVLLLEAPKASRAHALNIGILATRSRYIAYINETSHFRPGHLEKLTQIAEQERLGFVYSDLGLSTKGMEGAAVSGTDFDSDLLLRENYIPSETVLHRRDLLHEVGLFNEGLDSGMEWELWVYLTRNAAVRRVAEATVERVIGGGKGARLLEPGPARVRKFLVERFSQRGAERAITQRQIQVTADELVDGGDVVARAQELIKRGDWAGAAGHLVEAASRPLTALTNLFAPPYPERETVGQPVLEPTLVLQTRPRDRAAEQPLRRDGQGLPWAAGRRGDNAATTPAQGHVQMGREPVLSADLQAPAEASAGGQLAMPFPGGSRGRGSEAWRLMQTHGITGTGRSRGAAARGRMMAEAMAPAPRPATNGALGGPMMKRARRKAMSTVIQNPACPMCNDPNPTTAHRAGWYRVLDCSKCKVGFSHPRLDASLATRFFSDRRPTLVPPNIRRVEDLAGTPFDRSRELSWLKAHKNDGKLIDVGSSWGYGVAQARAAGFDAVGVELSRSLARTARERFEVEIHDADLLELQLEAASVESIMAIHVIQHMLDPRGFLAETFRLLQPGGVLVGSVPNFDAHLRETLGRRWRWLDPESQSYHFRPASLGRELEALGYQVDMWTSEGLYGDNALAQAIGVDEANEVAASGRGSELAFVAHKPPMSH